MTKPLAEIPRNIRQSGIREIMALVAQIPDAIHLEVGEPSFLTPDHIKRAAYDASMDGFTRYTASGGMLSLREAIVEKMRRIDKVETTAENIVCTIGGVGALAMSIMALVDAGDEVLISDPGWPNYEMQTLSVHGVPKRYPLLAENGYIPDVAEIERLITDKTKAIVINSPANPTGAVFPRETVRDLVAMAKRHGIYLISDEVYEELIFDGEHTSALEFDNECVITIHSMSKAYAMTGWRLGYAVVPLEMAKIMTKMQEAYISCPSSVSQKAAEAALSGPQEFVGVMREAYKRRRDLAVDILRKNDMLICVPNGAFYIMVDISRTGMDSYEFCKELVREEKVAAAPGGTFGELASQSVRVSLATADDALAEGLNRMAAFVTRKEKERALAPA